MRIAYSSPGSAIDRVRAVRDDQCICERVTETDYNLTYKMRAAQDEHEKTTQRIVPKSDTTRYEALDQAFCRRFWPAEAIQCRSRHEAHKKFMEERRLQSMHDLWELEKDEERRVRTRKLFRPEIAAVPEVPLHPLYRRPLGIYSRH